jgi:hypothetical protein
MRKIVKTCIGVVVLAIATGPLSIASAKTTKKEISEELKACYAACKSKKENLAYESCMIDCNKAEKAKAPQAQRK